jgi:hypothetical protein
VRYIARTVPGAVLGNVMNVPMALDTMMMHVNARAVRCLTARVAQTHAGGSVPNVNKAMASPLRVSATLVGSSVSSAIKLVSVQDA